ncbi:hypothetical protein [Methanosarcina acetivorans]|nr:hypothetical protein [Methanosarcina acetivorans]
MGETNYGKCECLSVKWGFRKKETKKGNQTKKSVLQKKRFRHVLEAGN